MTTSSSTSTDIPPFEIDNNANDNEETTPLFRSLSMIPNSAQHLRSGVDNCWDVGMRTPRSCAFNLLTLTKGEALATTTLALFEGLDQLKFVQLGGVEPSGYPAELFKSVKGVNWANGVNELVQAAMEIFEMNQGTKPCDGFFGSIVPRFFSLASSAVVVSADDENSKQLLAVEALLAVRDCL